MKKLFLFALLPAMLLVSCKNSGTDKQPNNNKQASENKFINGYPTDTTAQALNNETDMSRALIAYRFFYPTVSMEFGMEGVREAGGIDNASALIMACGPRHLLFTGNSDTPYMQGGCDLEKTGPMVIELPAGALLGVINDHNFRWIGDMGIPGPDAGKGGKHLIIPPGYTGKIPSSGYFVSHSKTYQLIFAVRAIPPQGDLQAAINNIQTIKVYPLSDPKKAADFKFVNVSDKKVDVTLLRGEDNFLFWTALNKVIQLEPASPEFHAMYGLLATLGIEKGKEFAPDARMKAILEKAAKTGKSTMLVSSFGSNRPDRFAWPDRKWEWAALRYENGDFETPTGIDFEARERWFSQAVGVSPKMFTRSTDAGSLYWLGYRDINNNLLDGGKTYKLTVPTPVPARLFWSVTVYDNETRSQIQTDQDKAALRSMFELKEKETGSTLDLYFGPKAPAGKEGVWIQTIPNKGWFSYFRIYGPESPAFDGTWKPGDFEEVK